MSTIIPVPIDEVSEWLNGSVSDVVGTMFHSAAEPMPPQELRTATEPLVVGSVGFAGDVNGVVYVHITTAFARTLASRMLGLAENELDDDMINDVVGELSNMIVGSVKSRLCDRGAPCVLTIPSIVRGQNFSIQPMRSSERRVLGFRCGTDQIVLELLTKNAA